MTTWFEASQIEIRRIEREHMHDGMTVRERERVLSDQYPFAMRMGSAYKAWLRARKQYLDRYRVHPPTPLEAEIYRQERAEKRRKGKSACSTAQSQP